MDGDERDFPNGVCGKCGNTPIDMSKYKCAAGDIGRVEPMKKKDKEHDEVSGSS